ASLQTGGHGRRDRRQASAGDRAPRAHVGRDAAAGTEATVSGEISGMLCRAATSDVTNILAAIDYGELQAVERLLPLVYDDMRRLAADRWRVRNLARRSTPPSRCTRRICG